MKQQKNKVKEAREVQAGVIANLVFRIQGSDKKYVQDKEGKKYAGQTLQEIIDHEVKQERKRLVKEAGSRNVAFCDKCGGLFKAVHERCYPPQKDKKKIEKLDIGLGWRGITFVNTDALLEDMALKLNEVIDYLNSLTQKENQK